jgi:enoyl-CoA hydratase/carnithine racemase
MTNLINIKIQDQLYFITINRPDKRNALTFEMVEALGDAARASDQHPEVRAIIVHGEGGMFSAGVDLFALAGMRAQAGEQNLGRWARRLADGLQHAVAQFEATELPVIGALHGQVLGLGLELALAFDLRVATDDCVFRMPEVSFGIVADVGGTTRLSRTIGPSRAKDMLMTGRTVSAEEALQWGLVNRVVPGPDALKAAIELGNQIAQNGPLAVGMFKRIIDQGDGLDKQSQMALERWAQSQLMSTDDVAEAFTAFVEKRKPKFKGK